MLRKIRLHSPAEPATPHAPRLLHQPPSIFVLHNSNTLPFRQYTIVDKEGGFCFDKFMDIGKKIRALREAKGLSQGDIEKRSGLLRSYISRVEGGYTTPSLTTLDKFAKALEVDSYQLLFRGSGQATAARIPPHALQSKSARKLTKYFENMSTANRKLLLTVASKLTRE
jgi:transcriptional regulator with XRE-family HTH domain